MIHSSPTELPSKSTNNPNFGIAAIADKGSTPQTMSDKTFDFDEVRRNWRARFAPTFGPPPEELPPEREVSHRIPLLDETMRYGNRTRTKCPESLFEQLREKVDRYCKAGWWRPATGTDAMPLLCIEKKNGTLRTVVDARLRNANTFLDVTPLPDLDMIRDRFARAKFRSKIDMTDAYEQIRIVPEDVWKTLFACPLGTFESLTLQQGDCNGPSTFQRLMTWVFRTKLGTWVFVYIDDIFVFTDYI